jgi:choline dehydrogenase-like flavoprotein
MILDARSLPDATSLDCDICIVGGGAAGITLALELAATQARICLLEAGGLRHERTAQSLLDGDAQDGLYPALRDTQLARFGGGTEVWAGWCRPFEPADFDARSWVPHSGWPIRYEALLPHYERAHELCGLANLSYDPRDWDARTDRLRLALPEQDFHATLFHASPVRFGSTYGARLQHSPHVQALLHCVARRLHLAPDSERVDRLDLATGDGRRLQLTARRVILAAGGIENARLLLASGDSPERSIGNQHDQVGRYFTQHGFVAAGDFVATPAAHMSALHFVPPHALRAARVRCAFSPQPALAQRERLLGAALFLQPRYESHAVYASDEVRAMLDLWDKWRGRGVPGNVAQYLRRALRSPGKLVHALARKALLREGPQPRRRMRALFEGLPDVDNRITLSAQRDALGRPLARVRWRATEQELRSVRRTHELFGVALQRAGLGRFEAQLQDVESWRAATEGAKHHMGATRMHADPRHGVVDADARVHGVHNLYVAGGSVFPTAGFANPTLTIVAMALRLAQHLKEQLAALP